MKASLALALLGLAAPAASAAPLFDFYGYSYLEGPAFTVGTVATLCMRFDPVQPEPALPLDLENQEYTVLVEGLEIVDIQQSGPILLVTYDDGILKIYEDPARNSNWAEGPPNGAVPGTFEDGTLILSGYFTSCILLYDTVLEVGTVEGDVTFQGGTRLVELLDPVDWYFFGGTTTRTEVGIPVGFDSAWDPQLLQPGPPVASRSTTWGTIKQLYR